MKHTWSAGAGGSGGGTGVDYTHINYPAYVTGFFFENNMWYKGTPRVTSCAATVAATAVTIAGAGKDDDGTIASYQVSIEGPTASSDTLAGGATFSKIFSGLANGSYKAKVTAADNEGKVSATCSTSFQIGAVQLLPPTSVTAKATSSSAITVSWNNAANASSYVVTRSGGSTGAVDATVTAGSGTTTSYAASGLTAATDYSFSVKSVNAAGSSTATSAVVAKTLSACTEYTSSNLAHVVANRALNVWGFGYAKGSGNYMGMVSSFIIATLAETKPGYFIVGRCPAN